MTDPVTDNGDYTYAVTAVYNVGESKAVKTTVKVTTGIQGVINDGHDAEYFDLHGIRIDKPVKGNIYLRRQGDRTEKVRF